MERDCPSLHPGSDMDVIYQLIVLGWIYPLELLTVTVALAVVPYILIRGPVNRLARYFRRKNEPGAKSERGES
jgi:hypothetical protein